MIRVDCNKIKNCKQVFLKQKPKTPLYSVPLKFTSYTLQKCERVLAFAKCNIDSAANLVH